jgi:hypothetical protein
LLVGGVGDHNMLPVWQLSALSFHLSVFNFKIFQTCSGNRLWLLKSEVAGQSDFLFGFAVPVSDGPGQRNQNDQRLP